MTATATPRKASRGRSLLRASTCSWLRNMSHETTLTLATSISALLTSFARSRVTPSAASCTPGWKPTMATAQASSIVIVLPE